MVTTGAGVAPPAIMDFDFSKASVEIGLITERFLYRFRVLPS
jgi:hypothetical protein